MCLSVRLSVRLSQVGALQKWLNIRSRKQHHTTGKRFYTFLRCQKSHQNSNEFTPDEGTKCIWRRLNADEVAENWRLSTRSVVNLAWSQVYNTCRDAMRRAGLSATANPRHNKCATNGVRFRPECRLIFVVSDGCSCPTTVLCITSTCKDQIAFKVCICRFTLIFSERSRSLYAIARPSVVCRLSSVTFVRPTQAVEIFGNISTALGTLAIH